MLANRRAQKRSSTHFRHTFENVNDTSEQFWNFQMYFVVSEYEKKVFCPLPLSIVYYLPQFIYKIKVGL